MTDSIVDGTNIDVNVFAYSAPKAHASGGKVVNLYNKHFKESLTLSTPLMLTWGAQEGQEQGTGKPTGKWTMSLQFPSADYSNADAEAFLRSMRALETKIKADAMTNSKEWFGKEIKSSEVIDEKFNVMLRHPKKAKGSIEVDENKPPTLTVKIPQWSGVWKPEIYDEDGEPLYIPDSLTSEQVKEFKTQLELDEAISLLNDGHSPIEYLPKQTKVICLLQCGGLWFVNGKVSITWNLQQAVVKKPKQSTRGICFIKPKANEREALKSMPHPEEQEQEQEQEFQVSSTLVDDSDDENDTKPSANPEPTQEVIIESEPVATNEPVKKSNGRKSKK